MFKLHLYTVSSEVNRVDKSSELSEDFTLNGTLKDDCSIINPMIMVAADVNIVGFNYAYVEEFKRYYFINDITALNNGMWELSMHVDVLMSFKDGLLKLPAFISRNENVFNSLLADTEVPILGNPEITIDEAAGCFEDVHRPPDTDKTMLIVFASNVRDGATYQGKTFKGGIFDTRSDGMGGPNLRCPSQNYLPWNSGVVCLIASKEVVAEILATAQLTPELLDNLIAIYSLPKISEDPSSTTVSGLEELAPNTPIGIFGEMSEGTETYKRILGFASDRKLYIARGYWTSSPTPFTFNTETYLDLAPYCERILALPFAEEFIIPPNVIDIKLSEHTLSIFIVIDWSNATISYFIVLDSLYLGYKSGTFGSLVPLQHSDIADIYARLNGVGISAIGSGLANLIGTAGNIAGGFLNGNVGKMVSGAVGGVAGATSTIFDTMAEYAKMVPSTTVQKGDSQMFNSFSSGKIRFITKRYVPTISDGDIAQFRSLYGSPLMDVKSINELHGYTQIKEIHLEDFYATSTEKDEIATKLKSGVILP